MFRVDMRAQEGLCCSSTFASEPLYNATASGVQIQHMGLKLPAVERTASMQ
jgi:hypothetical protein